jgi:hypothetical protein
MLNQSHRKNKSKFWMILIGTICISFGISTYAWASYWLRIFCENGFYFNSTEKNLADRQMDGLLTSHIIVTVDNSLFAVQVINNDT